MTGQEDLQLPTRERNYSISASSLNSSLCSRNGDGAPAPECPSTCFPESASVTSGSECLGQDEENTARAQIQVVRALWSSEAASVTDIQEWDLPCLGRVKPHCRTDHKRHATPLRRSYSSGYYETTDVGNTPLLLYAMHKCSKVLGSMLKANPETGQLTSTGPQLSLPVSYSGWFQFVQNANTAVHSLTTIEEVSKARLKEFVVHSPVTGYRYAKKSEEGNKMYIKVTVPGGEVLTTKSVLTEWLSDESINTSSCFCFGKPKTKPEVSYLKCRDSCGRRLVLPFHTAGGFSEVGLRGAEIKENASYQLSDIARWMQLPVQLKQVCGQTPDSLEGYTGLLRLDEMFLEHSLVACTAGIRKDHTHHLVEFSAGSDLELVQCQNWKELERTDAVESALLHCEENFASFVTDMKVVNNIESDNKCPDVTETEIDAMLSQVRALPPTPQLPRVAKRKRSRAWMWAKNFLKRNSATQEDTTSEDSDYEVIPFYLRTIGNTINDSTNLGSDFSHLSISMEHKSFAEDSMCRSHEGAECDGNEAGRASLSSPKTPRIPASVVDAKPCDCAHDEDGYLLPVEYRESANSKMADVASCAVLSDKSEAVAMSTSYHSSALDTCSSATVTRDTEDTTCSLNKSTETLLAPPSSGTIRTYINSVTDSDYSATRFDKDRLDAFLTDSILELHRRQSKEHLLVKFRDKKPEIQPLTKRDSAPLFENKTDMDKFLNKIFDCDSMTVEDKEANESQSSNISPDMPLTGRSMSVPENILTRSLDPRMFRPALEYGYQTLDSGIWLSPRSAVSDPYRQERDSATYRSTSDCSWVPPEHITPLTVEEVGLSLRFIGMKEHIVTRFCEEQIDGKQLAELNEGLLMEGFPELNALDRKKLIDFIKGWRPKKWGYIPME